MQVESGMVGVDGQWPANEALAEVSHAVARETSQ